MRRLLKSDVCIPSAHCEQSRRPPPPPCRLQSLSVCLVLFECILRAQFMIPPLRSTVDARLSVATPLLNSSPLQGEGEYQLTK